MFVCIAFMLFAVFSLQAQILGSGKPSQSKFKVNREIMLSGLGASETRFQDPAAPYQGQQKLNLPTPCDRVVHYLLKRYYTTLRPALFRGSTKTCSNAPHPCGYQVCSCASLCAFRAAYTQRSKLLKQPGKLSADPV